MEDNIIRKKQGNIRQGRNLFHAKKIHAYLKLSMLYNWGLIGWTHSPGGWSLFCWHCLRDWGVFLSSLPPAYINKYFHPLLDIFFFSLNSCFPSSLTTTAFSATIGSFYLLFVPLTTSHCNSLWTPVLWEERSCINGNIFLLYLWKDPSTWLASAAPASQAGHPWGCNLPSHSEGKTQIILWLRPCVICIHPLSSSGCLLRL